MTPRGISRSLCENSKPITWSSAIFRLRVFNTLIGLSTFVLSLSSPAAAQDADPPENWNVSAEFSWTDQSGNKVLRLLTGGLNVSHLRREEFRLDATVETRYGRSEGELVALSHSGSLAFDFRPESAWSPFLTTDAERDEFKRLDVRISSGAGAKYTLQGGGLEEASFSLALLHSYQRIAPQESALPEDAFVTVTHKARWSFRARATHDVRDGITLRHTTFYQPVWDEVANYLLRSETGLKVLLTERLALSADYQLKRDARPPDGVEPNDRLFRTGLIIDF